MKKQEEEWSQWYDHDGKGCPYPVGTIVHVRYLRPTPGFPQEAISTIKRAGGGQSWWFTSLERSGMSSFTDKDGVRKLAIPIIKYRVKKPKGLVVLEQLMATLEYKGHRQLERVS